MIVIDTLMVGIKNIIFTSGVSIFFGFYTLYNIFYYVKLMEEKTMSFSELLQKYDDLNTKYIDLQEQYNCLQQKYTTLTTCPSNDSLAFTHSSGEDEQDDVGVELEQIYATIPDTDIVYTNVTLEQHIVLEEHANRNNTVFKEEKEEDLQEELKEKENITIIERKVSIHDMKLDESTDSMKALKDILDEKEPQGIKIYKKVIPTNPLDESFQMVEPNRIKPQVGLEDVNWVKLGFGMFGIKM